MFDSPIHFCPLCREWVALDDSVAECAARHGCLPQVCPLAALFRFARAATPRQRPDVRCGAGAEERAGS